LFNSLLIIRLVRLLPSLLKNEGKEIYFKNYHNESERAPWHRGQCVRRAIAEAKQHSQRPVIGWVTKIYNLELLRASECPLSRSPSCICSRYHPLQFQGGLTSGRRPVVKIIAESLTQHDETHVVPTPLSVGKGKE
jgi:hypothetical protein